MRRRRRGSKAKWEWNIKVDQQAVEKKPATKVPHEIDVLLLMEQYSMDLLLLYEVKEWERLFWDKFKAFLDEIGND